MNEIDFKTLVIEKAREIFIKFGYKKTTMNDVAKACNKSKGLIYHHYKSKEEIFRIVANNEINNFFSSLQKEVGSKTIIKDKLKTFLLIWFNFLNDETTLSHKILLEFFDYMIVIKDILYSLHIKLLNTIKDILTEGVENNFFNIKDVNQTSTVILEMMNDFSFGLIRHILNLDKINSGDIDNFIEIIFYGLVKK